MSPSRQENLLPTGRFCIYPPKRLQQPLLDVVGNWCISRALGDEGIEADTRGVSRDVSRTQWQGQGPGQISVEWDPGVATY